MRITGFYGIVLVNPMVYTAQSIQDICRHLGKAIILLHEYVLDLYGKVLVAGKGQRWHL